MISTLTFLGPPSSIYLMRDIKALPKPIDVSEKHGLPLPVCQALYSWMGETNISLPKDVEWTPDYDKLIALLARGYHDHVKLEANGQSEAYVESFRDPKPLPVGESPQRITEVKDRT